MISNLSFSLIISSFVNSFNSILDVFCCIIQLSLSISFIFNIFSFIFNIASLDLSTNIHFLAPLLINSKPIDPTS